MDCKSLTSDCTKHLSMHAGGDAVAVRRGQLRQQPDGARGRWRRGPRVRGEVRGGPRRTAGASRGSPRVPRDARKGALERLGACRGDQNRHQVASGSGKIEFSLRCAFAKHCRSDFSSIFIDFCFFCKVCEPLKVLRLSTKTEVRPFALRVESLACCNLEKPRKSTRKSTRNRRKSMLRRA